MAACELSFPITENFKYLPPYHPKNSYPSGYFHGNSPCWSTIATITTLNDKKGNLDPQKMLNEWHINYPCWVFATC